MKHYYNLKLKLRGGLSLLALVLGSSSFAQLYPFDMHTFTNGGAEGANGPMLPAVVAEYTGGGAAWAADPMYLTMTTQGIQEWTVPSNGDYTIAIGGAQGGDHEYDVDPEDGGLGALMEGTFALVEGQVLHILVGQQGVRSRADGGFSVDNAAPGGGGGTFVWDPTDTSNPLIAAGGGGGGTSPGGFAGRDANTTIDGNEGELRGNGGTAGNGGMLNTGGASYWAGGGCGWITNGTAGNATTLYDPTPSGASSAGGGVRPLEGGIGGEKWVDGGDTGEEGGDGGFGGGGGGGSDNMGSGGGGGYSGGGGNNGTSRSGGGGGSFNSGIDQVNSVGNTGHGFVTITLLCTPLTITASDVMVCNGELVNLSAMSTTGGTITWDMGITDGVDFIPPSDATTTYSAISTSPDDCNFAIDVVSTAIPTIVATSDVMTACEGAFVTVLGMGGDTYTWTGSGAIDPVDGVSFPSEGGSVTYTVTGSLMGCEGPTDEITIVGASQPDVVANSTETEICLGESFTLTGSGAFEYNWGGAIEDGDVITPDAPGTFIYTLIGTSEAGCGDTGSVAVVVSPIPFADAGADVTVCEGSEVTLTGSGAGTITWSPSITDGVPFAVDAGATTYTLTVTNEFGCTDDDEVVVTGFDVPVITGTVTGEFELFEGAIDIEVTGGTGSYAYSWSNGAITQDIFGLGEGDYTVIVDDIGVETGICPDATETFTVVSFVGIEDEAISILNAYPNPTTDLVTVTYNGEFNYEVISPLGQVIISGKAVDKEELSLETLSNGTYLVKVISGDKINFVQVVKQ